MPAYSRIRCFMVTNKLALASFAPTPISTAESEFNEDGVAQVNLENGVYAEISSILTFLPRALAALLSVPNVTEVLVPSSSRLTAARLVDIRAAILVLVTFFLVIRTNQPDSSTNLTNQHEFEEMVGYSWRSSAVLILNL